jgi:hypothetical protein
MVPSVTLKWSIVKGCHSLIRLPLTNLFDPERTRVVRKWDMRLERAIGGFGVGMVIFG